MPDPYEPRPKELQFPLFVKAPLILLTLTLLVFTIHVASAIIFPLFFAAIFAIMLHPIEQWLLRHRVPKLLAITLTVVLGVVSLLGLLYFIYAQAVQLSSQMPLFRAKLAQTTDQVHQWLQNQVGVSDQKLQSVLSEAGSRASALLGSTLSAVSGLVVVATLIPVYIFLLLLYQKRLVDFLTQVFSRHHNDTSVLDVLHESKATIRSYMVGLLIEASIVASLNTTALLIIGVPYALLLGVLGALLNFIPYIGGLIAIALPVLMAFVTKPGYGHALAVILAYMLIQFTDNHLLIPRIVASKVKVNALVAIVGVLVANAIGGIAGMFLALPVIAILKIVFDRIPALKPWGLLLGDEEGPRAKRTKKNADNQLVVE
ncbi:AI-2E family transporter [Hymenobacter sp. BT664]|uniref:AI-2E family transporter n=1 Tax=Hymenobacter montanus TaxID=2771359 RepID=A0A927BCS0_9BACT|nr:AI-2E family transporter [Hymenobacter montanus]MBD2767593.1 AI-2E family transporter [Hymenobacter montanus]